jgi:hypothetical protein
MTATEFHKIADRPGPMHGTNEYGNGKVIGGQPCWSYEALKIARLEYVKPERIRFLYIVRPNDFTDKQPNQEPGVLRHIQVKGMEAEIWHPETGKIEPASYKITKGKTTVTLNLTPDDAVFVVFRNKAKKQSLEVSPPRQNHLTTVEGPWEISFQSNRGAPEKITSDTLFSLNLSADPGVRYFSGTTTYTTQVDVPEEWFSDQGPLWMDLGEVKNLAEVLVNDSSVGIVWKMPFRLNINDALKPGNNKLEIKVTNLWVNRLIGDQQPGTKEKYLYYDAIYQSDSPLMPSGLIRPV